MILLTIADGNSDHQAEGEAGIDNPLPEFGVLAAIFLIEVQLRGIVGERGEEDVVGFGHGPADRVLEDLSDLQFVKVKPGHFMLPIFLVQPCKPKMEIAAIP